MTPLPSFHQRVQNGWAHLQRARASAPEAEDYLSKVGRAWGWVNNAMHAVVGQRAALVWSVDSLKRTINSLKALPSILKQVVLKTSRAAQKILGKIDLGRFVAGAGIAAVAAFTLPIGVYGLYQSIKDGCRAVKDREWEIAVDHLLDGLERIGGLFGGVAAIGTGLEALAVIATATWVTTCAFIGLGLGAFCIFKAGLNAIQTWRVQRAVRIIIAVQGDDKKAALVAVKTYLNSSLGAKKVQKYFGEDLSYLNQRLDALAQAKLPTQQRALGALERRLNTHKWSLVTECALYIAGLAGAALLLNPATAVAAPFIIGAVLLGMGGKVLFDWHERTYFKNQLSTQ